MKNRPQKIANRRPSAVAQTPTSGPAKPKWLDGQTLFFVILITLIGLTSILFPLNFYLFAVNAQSSLPVPVQILWTLAGIGALLLVARNAIPRVPGWALFIVAGLSITSFFVLRTTYPTLMGDGTPPAKHFIFHVDTYSFPRIQDFLSFKLASVIPRGIDFPYHRSNLFDNQLASNAYFIVTWIFAIAAVVLALVMVQRLRALANGERLGLLVLLLCSAPMLNGYGDFQNYMGAVFIISLWFIFLWFLYCNSTYWRIYAALPFLFILCSFTHPLLLQLPGLLFMMLGLIFLRSKRIAFPLWFTVVCAAGLGFTPLILAPNQYLATLRLDDLFGLNLCARLLGCIEIALPALILSGLVIWQNRKTLRHATPIQTMALMILVSSILQLFTSGIESVICMTVQYSMFGSLIYGSAIVLYLSTRRDPRPVFYSAILGCFLFVPSVYVHSDHLLLKRHLTLLPSDRSSTVYQMWGPYLKLGLGTPLDTPENRRYKLDVFKAGVTNTIPDWQKFRGLNLMFYTAWCFEFGEYREGKDGLIQLFGQPQALQDLWHSGTRFTVFYENKAYKRIRMASRQIIRDNLNRSPSNRYFLQLSDLLDAYERQDP